jgi:hypothetical protein
VILRSAWEALGKQARQAPALEEKLRELELAWEAVRHNVPQHESSPLHPDNLRHGIRQLASLYSGEKTLLPKRLAQARRETVEECAALCEQIWKDAPNESPEYRQNSISHGCLASANAIRARFGSEE